MELWWNDNDKEKPTGEQLAPVTLSPPQISCGLTWDQTRTSAVRGRVSHGTSFKDEN
jgi:hypothetical protein